MNQFKTGLERSLRKQHGTLIVYFSSLLIFFFLEPAWGATYYMRADGNAAGKSAATSCSSAAGAMSVATHNKQTLSPDDTVFLCDNGGTYTSSIIVPSSGTAGHPITYANAPGSTPVIDLSMVVSGWSGPANGVYTAPGYGRVLWEDDHPLKPASGQTLADGNWYYSIGSMRIQYRPTSGTPANHTVRTMWFEGDLVPAAVDLRNCSNVTIQGLSITRSGSGIHHGQNLASPVTPITNIIIRDNKITESFWAIWAQVIKGGIESDVSIHNNYIDYCNSGISAWTNSDQTPGHTQYHTGYSITHNTINHHYSITDTQTWNDALLTSYYWTDHEAISFQDVQNSMIANNTINATFERSFTNSDWWTRAFIIFMTSSTTPTTGISFIRNSISGHFSPAVYVSGYSGFAGFSGNVYAYNHFHYVGTDPNHGAFAVRFTSDNPMNGANYFINNTISNDNAGGALDVPYHKIGNWVFRNNIVNSPGIFHVNSDFNAGNIMPEYNIYNSSGSMPFMIGGSAMPFATWQKNGYDVTGSRVANPLFVNQASGDFHLAGGSPGIYAGVNVCTGANTPLSGCTGPGVGEYTDYAGKPVHNPPSIGAYEFEPAALPPPRDLKLLPKQGD
jgi:hypothetical protein